VLDVIALLHAGHDPNDYEIGKRVGLETINIMNKDGSLNAAAGAASAKPDVPAGAH
jgi:valyl-tRNA synthetase